MMATMQQKLKWFGAQIATVCTRTYHYCRPNNAAVPYAVWAEDSEAESFHACEWIRRYKDRSFDFFIKDGSEGTI